MPADTLVDVILMSTSVSAGVAIGDLTCMILNQT